MRPFDIFYAGKHVSASGAALDFSEADLQRSAAVYDPAKHEAPIVIGHPKDNLPAFGWIEKLNFTDGELVAAPKDVDPEFADMVAKRRFPKRSASFYSPGSPNHPLAGTADHDTYYLRHVGFLGAAPPSLKGLREVAFNAADDGVIEFVEAVPYAWSSLYQILSSLRDMLIADKGIEVADKTIPKYYLGDIDAAGRAAVSAAVQPSIPSFSSPEDTDMTLTPQQIADLQAKAARTDALEAENATLKTSLTKVQADFAEANTAMTAMKRELAIGKIKADLQQHVTAGRLLPAQVEAEAEFIAGLDDSVQTFDFTEGEGAAATTKKESARARYLRQLGDRPKIIDFGERSAAAAGPTQPQTVDAAQRAIMDQFSGKAKT